MVKIIITIMLFMVIASMAVSLFSLVKDGESTDRTVKFLTIRIVLSIGLFLFIATAFFMGWIQPHGIAPSTG